MNAMSEYKIEKFYVFPYITYFFYSNYSNCFTMQTTHVYCRTMVVRGALMEFERIFKKNLNYLLALFNRIRLIGKPSNYEVVIGYEH